MAFLDETPPWARPAKSQTLMDQGNDEVNGAEIRRASPEARRPAVLYAKCCEIATPSLGPPKGECTRHIVRDLGDTYLDIADRRIDD